MKKNLLIAVLLLLTVSSVWAKDYNVETKKFKSWGEAQFDAETATITFTKNWQGGGWWLSRLDCSAYDCIVIEFEEALPMDVMFMATYSAKDDKDQLFLNWNRHIKILLTVWVSVQQKRE